MTEPREGRNVASARPCSLASVHRQPNAKSFACPAVSNRRRPKKSSPPGRPIQFALAWVPFACGKTSPFLGGKTPACTSDRRTNGESCRPDAMAFLVKISFSSGVKYMATTWWRRGFFKGAFWCIVLHLVETCCIVANSIYSQSKRIMQDNAK